MLDWRNVSCLAEIAIPSLNACLRVLGPVAAVAAFLWLMRNADELIRRHLPRLEWDRQLGWFNIRAEQRARRFLRGVAAIMYLLLAAALYGILWGAEGLQDLVHWRDPEVLLRVQNHLPVLVLGAGLWALYLGGELMPRLRREFEEEELERYRAEQAALEGDEEATTTGARTLKPTTRSTAPPRYRPRL